MCYLSAVFAVVHHENFEVLQVVNDKFEESIGKDVSSLLIGAVADVWHDNTASLELSTHTRIDTLGTTPAFL